VNRIKSTRCQYKFKKLMSTQKIKSTYKKVIYIHHIINIYKLLKKQKEESNMLKKQRRQKKSCIMFYVTATYIYIYIYIYI